MQMPGNNLYSVKYVEDVVSRDIPSLSKSAKTLILKAIEERLMIDPVSFGKPLRYTLKGYRRLRVGRYRIVYKIDEKKRTVIINAIDHRKDAYT